MVGLPPLASLRALALCRASCAVILRCCGLPVSRVLVMRPLYRRRGYWPNAARPWLERQRKQGRAALGDRAIVPHARGDEPGKTISVALGVFCSPRPWG
jgi:hypothetical protein